MNKTRKTALHMDETLLLQFICPLVKMMVTVLTSWWSGKPGEQKVQWVDICLDSHGNTQALPLEASFTLSVETLWTVLVEGLQNKFCGDFWHLW